jgi:Uma2 family endonuclease
MAAPAYNPSVEQILALHAEFEPPEGHKAEVIGGTIVVSPSPSRRHGFIFSKLDRQLSQLLPTNLMVTVNITLEMSATGERYIPDLLVAHEDALRSDDWLLDAAEAELVAEIVSPHNARHDRVTKVRAYAASGVPIYLLVDPLEQAVTLFFEPSGDCYEQMHRVPFGATISLPEPYVGKIDTSVFA